MFVYVFGRYFGGDKVARWGAASDFGVAAGDIIRLDSDLMLCLGETCAFEETVAYTIPSMNKPDIHFREVISEKGLAMIHRFVAYWYTTYHKAIPLWVGSDDHIEGFLRNASTKPLSKPKRLSKIQEVNVGAQCLIVVPDLWTAQSVILDQFERLGVAGCLNLYGSSAVFSSMGSGDEKRILFLHSQSTDKQKKDAYWSLKTGKNDLLVCTPSQLFQDRHNLQQIILLDQHKWRYKNQQDPRYDAVRVVQVWAEKLGIHLILTGSVLTSDL